MINMINMIITINMIIIVMIMNKKMRYHLLYQMKIILKIINKYKV